MKQQALALAMCTLAGLSLAETTPVAPPAQNNRYALVIGIGHYSDSHIPALKGVQYDMVSASQMAQSMSIPEQNISYLRDDQASASNIKAEIARLNQRLLPGDRVFVYYSGHGTRWHEPGSVEGSCTEGLLASDGEVLSNKEISQLLSPLAKKTDKLLVFYDACFSGGIAAMPLKTRAVSLNGEWLTPKFATVPASASCVQPSNFKTRSFDTAFKQEGGLPQNVVHIAASRPDEVSFDDGNHGGMATVAWRDCLLGEAKDNSGSGSVTVEDITRCAQDKLDQRLAGKQNISGQHMSIGGNRSFVPAWIKSAFVTPVVAPVDAAASQAAVSAIKPPVISQNPPSLKPVDNKPMPLEHAVAASPARILELVHAQRDGSREVLASLASSKLRIGKDKLGLTVTSRQDGYLYIALAGSDGKSLYLLYPNKLDDNNMVKAGQTLQLPHQAWQIDTAGPAGKDTLLVMVADSPRDLSRLKAVPAGPFMQTLLDPQGRSLLQQVLSTSANIGAQECSGDSGHLRNLMVARHCADSFASTLLSVQETR